MLSIEWEEQLYKVMMELSIQKGTVNNYSLILLRNSVHNNSEIIFRVFIYETGTFLKSQK